MTPVVAAAGAGAVAGGLLWLWLRTGRYRDTSDEPRRSLTHAWLVVPVAAAAGGVAGTSGAWATIAVSWVFLVGATAIVWIDLDVHRVPDRVLALWGPVLVGTAVTAAAITDQWLTVARAGAAAAALFGCYLLLAVVGSMGFGDVKLAAVTGAALGWLGWPAVVTGTVAAFILAGFAAVILLIRGAGRTSHLAFGPAIIAGAAVATLMSSGLAG